MLRQQRPVAIELGRGDRCGDGPDGHRHLVVGVHRRRGDGRWGRAEGKARGRHGGVHVGCRAVRGEHPEV